MLRLSLPGLGPHCPSWLARRVALAVHGSATADLAKAEGCCGSCQTDSQGGEPLQIPQLAPFGVAAWCHTPKASCPSPLCPAALSWRKVQFCIIPSSLPFCCYVVVRTRGSLVETVVVSTNWIGMLTGVPTLLVVSGHALAAIFFRHPSPMLHALTHGGCTPDHCWGLLTFGARQKSPGHTLPF